MGQSWMKIYFHRHAKCAKPNRWKTAMPRHALLSAAMNIPPEVARAQDHHGVKGAVHGIKGGRPRLQITVEERKERRRQQHQAWRRRNGIPPKEVLTWKERQERNRRQRDKRFNEEYRRIWRKLPGEPLTAGEFATR